MHESLILNSGISENFFMTYHIMSYHIIYYIIHHIYHISHITYHISYHVSYHVSDHETYHVTYHTSYNIPYIIISYHNIYEESMFPMQSICHPRVNMYLVAVIYWGVVRVAERVERPVEGK